MKLLLILSVLSLSFVVVFGSSEQENLETKERSKRAPNYREPNYGNNNDNNDGCGSNYNDLYSPPYCKTPNACRPPEQITVVDNTWVSSPRQYYVTMATCYAQKLFGSVLLNRPPRTNQELNEMCLSLFLINGTTFFDGYGKQFSQDCQATADGNGLKCDFNTENSDDSVDSNIYPTEDCYLIASDNSTYALYYRCIDKKYEDLMLITTRPTVEQPVMSKVVDVALKYRIPINQIKPFQCYPPTYPFPFQNYLQNSCSSSQYSSQSSYSSSTPPTPPPRSPASPPHYGNNKNPPRPHYPAEPSSDEYY